MGEPPHDLVQHLIDTLRRDLGQTLTMLQNAVEACPPEVWAAPGDGASAAFWQQAYHTISSVDFWMDERTTPFAFPPFHTKAAGEMHADPGPAMPQEQVREYMHQVLARCRQQLDHLSEQSLMTPAIIFGRPFPLLQRIVGQIRHTQHHVGTMHALLRRKTGAAPQWV